MAGTFATYTGADNMVRFVRFAPWHLSRPGPELDAWVAKHVPRGIGREARHISRHQDAVELNARYARTLDALGRSRLRRRPASILLDELVREGDAAVAWKRHRAADRNTVEREAEDEFMAHRKGAAHAARTVAHAFRNRSFAAEWTATAAVIKGMEEVPVPDWPAAGDGTVPTALPAPFLHWRAPASVAGSNPRIADYLVDLMERLAQECDAATPGGYHRRRHGPFLYPGGGAPPRNGHDLLVNGLLYVAVRAARRATGAPAARDVGAPMPKRGRPLYALAAAYVHDVTAAAHPRRQGIDLCATAARERLAKLLRRSPGLVCRGWAADRDR